jgi:hypothetical protein
MTLSGSHLYQFTSGRLADEALCGSSKLLLLGWLADTFVGEAPWSTTIKVTSKRPFDNIVDKALG